MLVLWWKVAVENWKENYGGIGEEEIRIYEIYLKLKWIPYSNFNGKVYALANICMNS